MKIVIALLHPFSLWNAPSWLGERLRSTFPNLTIDQLPDFQRLSSAVTDAEILLAWSIRPEQFVQAKRLRWIHSSAAAVHQLMFPELVNSDVIVTNARQVHAPVVAEHIIASVFALAKKLPTAVRMQQRSQWGQELLWETKPAIKEVAGSTACIIGMGSIGREFTLRARALGMRVIAVREHPERGPSGADSVYGPAELKIALAQSDFVILAAPLTSSTRAIINAESLTYMRQDAYLINVGRGPLIDDASLISALRDRRIAGAALDVFAEEPLTAHSPYWTLENVLITPHTAAVTEKLWERHYALIADNLSRFLANQPLLGVVDKNKGY
ncbi:MAG TPA: D-2-hydroxyacid dehydrogenase [Terriglobales bacterium]|nr:D-2-hydroxyacid dehydrogenase [Terriglobales bacterium]